MTVPGRPDLPVPAASGEGPRAVAEAEAHVAAAALAAGVPEHLVGRVASFARPGAARATARPLVACDLDRTLVYSAAALGLVGEDRHAPDLVVAEVFHGEPLSFQTRAAQDLLAVLARVATLVPTTTRTRSQYARIRIPGRPYPYAVTTNGGQLLVDGKPCPRWAQRVAEELAQAAPLAEVHAHLARVAHEPWVRKLRVADDMFTYLVVERGMVPSGYVDDLSAWCEARGWTVSVQGRKVYCVPATLTKSAAVAEIARRAEAGDVLAAGDSLLDGELLEAADRGVRPAHGELHETEWRAPHVAVTSASGVLAGEEIVARLLADVLSSS
ncbi:HAD family hydrolase [Cellulomonas edaphi]|uniref:HAD family hydrolase n=1 Tax=Cellulomonas edaphi TaxID=3053468 RepID=A0ABT7S578_9CELL|nr:HAD family hydrolase [Cellulomons edaphi]MDM7830736.1 HAD family hydrolase [Cellulomons edaphi]